MWQLLCIAFLCGLFLPAYSLGVLTSAAKPPAIFLNTTAGKNYTNLPNQIDISQA
jgi:hypothetical protein